jgi:hypothetical protein
MSRPCSICELPNIDDVNALLTSGVSVREVSRNFDLARATLGRHASHLEADRPTNADTSTIGSGERVGTQLAAALDLIAEVKARAGDAYGAQDHAEGEHLLLLAGAVDASPSVASIRELRLTLSEFRRAAEPEDEDERFAVAALVAALSPKPTGTTRGR